MSGVDPGSDDFRAGYKSGYTHGWLKGFDDAEHDMANHWAHLAHHIRTLGPTHAALVQLRDRDTKARTRPVPTPEQCEASWERDR